MNDKKAYEEIQINLGSSTHYTKVSNPKIQPSCIFLPQLGAPECSYMMKPTIIK